MRHSPSSIRRNLLKRDAFSQATNNLDSQLLRHPSSGAAAGPGLAPALAPGPWAEMGVMTIYYGVACGCELQTGDSN